jgi:aryl-alcohol dehydrogenase-like predicted oxidoreductase
MEMLRLYGNVLKRPAERSDLVISTKIFWGGKAAMPPDF